MLSSLAPIPDWLWKHDALCSAAEILACTNLSLNNPQWHAYAVPPKLCAVYSALIRLLKGHFVGVLSKSNAHLHTCDEHERSWYGQPRCTQSKCLTIHAFVMALKESYSRHATSVMKQKPWQNMRNDAFWQDNWDRRYGTLILCHSSPFPPSINSVFPFPSPYLPQLLSCYSLPLSSRSLTHSLNYWMTSSFSIPWRWCELCNTVQDT